MRLLAILFSCLLVIQFASANWMFDVFEEVKDGVQEGMKEALDNTDAGEKFKAGVKEHLSGGAKNWKILSNKVKDVFNEIKPKVYSPPQLDLAHLHRFKWSEEDLKNEESSFFDKAMKSATDFSESEPESTPLSPDAPEVGEESGIEVERKHHRGKHGRHHGKHHKKHGRHHGGHKHHRRRPHHGPQQANETMESFHERLREAFEKDNATANNPFRNSWQSIVKNIQGALSGGSWQKIHKHVKSVIKEIKQEAKNVSKLARVPLHRMDWNEHRILKLEKVFSKLADKWGDAMKNAFKEPTTKASSAETEEKPVTAEELAFIDEPKTLEEKKSLIKLVSATEPQLEYGLEKVDTTEEKMSKLENEWEKRVEKEEEEFTKEILKDHDDEEGKPEKKTPGFPVHKGVVVPAPGEVEATKPEDEDDDIDFLPMAPVELTDLGPTEVEPTQEAEPETYASYLGIPAKIFQVGESAESAEKMLKDEEKIFFKKLAEERKEWLEMKETLLKKLAAMGKHKKH